MSDTTLVTAEPTSSSPAPSAPLSAASFTKGALTRQLLYALGFFVLLWIGVYGLAMARSIIVPAPFTYTESVYQPRVAAICPDEGIVYEIGLNVVRASVVDLVRVVWSLDEDRRVAWLQPEPTIWTDHEVGTTITEEISLSLPPLPPGRYEIRGSRVERGRLETQALPYYRVPFTVREGCTSDEGSAVAPLVFQAPVITPTGVAGRFLPASPWVSIVRPGQRVAHLVR